MSWSPVEPWRLIWGMMGGCWRCDGTTEDLGTDEVAKQAKYFLGPAVSKKRPALLKAGFAEQTDMNDEYVAITFHKTVDFQRFDEVLARGMVDLLFDAPSHHQY